MTQVLTRYLLFLTITIHFSAFSQTQLIRKIDTAAIFVTVDNLDNVYLLTPKNELLKYDAKGKLCATYSNKSLGKPLYLDVADPLRLVLYDQGFQLAVVLNNNLNEISRYSFAAKTSQQITLMASAATQGYWIFDQGNRELHKLSNDFEDELQSGNIYQKTRLGLQPSLIQSDDQQVYLYDSGQGVLLFDRFGGYIKTVLTDSLDYFQVKDKWLVYLYQNSLKKLNLQTYESKMYTLPVVLPIKQISMGSKMMAILTEKAVFLYLL